MLDTIATIFDQADELMREVVNKKVMRMLREQVKKNREIADLMKQVLVIEEEKARKRRREQDKKWLRRNYDKRWEKEEQRKRKEEENR